MADDLEQRLKSHARAFEGLMSLIPAQEYYGKDASITSNQWRRLNKPQTKEERQAAKRAKLDPASHKTAKDVMDENARKRRRELEAEDSSDIEVDVEKEKPFEGMKVISGKTKKQKTDHDTSAEVDTAKQADAGAENKPQQKTSQKKKEKRERKKEKLDQLKEKQDKKQQDKKQQKREAPKEEFDAAEDQAEQSEEEDTDAHAEDDHGDDHIQDLDVSGLEEEVQSTATLSADSALSASSIVSAASSSSSIIPPPTADSAEKEKKSPRPVRTIDPKQQEAFKARLAAKLEAMRTARKADGPDGLPARNRAELIEARRKKQAERKAARKANRQLAKEDEARLKAEAELAQLRGSGSPSLFSYRTTPEQEHNLSFGRVAWNDGQQLETNLSGFLESRKRKGPSDPKTALEAAEKKRSRISALDEEKRKDIEQKDLWLTAKKRAQGEKVHDDAALLRKNLKRKEKAKAKSKQEWKDRITNIEKGREMKQKKREENLKKRKEDKGSKGKKSKKLPKKPKRPGFEGTFKGR
ncbi:SURF6-domain-containing protein [Zopfia rhizophila CBS 207.26]|uniref:SURF6-domain-containing protein n=1 Tax=Zopfia rhizophila CBS 207.26 TaxID=1314779 RepID=A0A6A6EZY7_9PEZI|nr:SURF6-domain-containing protein [Zopfia rhizophila CBS 207.26]